VLDHHGRLQYLNRAGAEMLGYQEKELIGQIIHHHIHQHARSDHMPLSQCPAFQAAAHGESYRGEEWFRRSSGEVFPVEMRTRPLVERGRHIGSVSLFIDISKHKSRERKLIRLAQTDALTGLPNRAAFLAAARHELVQLKATPDKRSALILLDLDWFKAVNDSHGHAAGDAVLKRLAEVLCKGVRTGDVPARLGGEEFVVLLPDASLEVAMKVAERIRLDMGEAEVIWEGRSIRVTLSAGISPLHSSDQGVEEALARADEALYRAKNQGRNRVEGPRSLGPAQPA
jgi:diguanylate cyclase